MSGHVGCVLLSIIWLFQEAQGTICRADNRFIQSQAYTRKRDTVLVGTHYTKSLRFNIYTFTVAAADSGRIRNLQVKAFRGELLLTNFTIKVDGAIVGAEVADLDNNRFPELYIYSSSDGSGSFGRVYGWQFLPERKADIIIPNWRTPSIDGYMGHDSIWVEQAILCRKFPAYKAGDANATPSGGYKMMRYHLKPSGNQYALVVE